MATDDQRESRIAQLRRRARERRLRRLAQRRTAREARSAFAAASPLNQLLRSQQERPEGGVRGGARGILPTLEAAFPTGEELGKAATRVGTVPGGMTRAGRTVIGKPLAFINERVLGRLPLVGGTFERAGKGLREVIARQEQAEEEVRPSVFLPNRMLSDVAKFMLEFETARSLPGVGRLLRRRPTTAKTVAGRIAQRGLTEGAQFGLFESGLSLLEGETLEEAASRARFGFAAGAVLGGAAKGVGEFIGRGGAARLAQLTRMRNRRVAEQNLQEAAQLRQKVQPKIQQLGEAERIARGGKVVETNPQLVANLEKELSRLEAVDAKAATKLQATMDRADATIKRLEGEIRGPAAQFGIGSATRALPGAQTSRTRGLITQAINRGNKAELALRDLAEEGRHAGLRERLAIAQGEQDLDVGAELFQPEGFALVAEAGALDATGIGRGIMRFLRRNLTSRGDLPKKVHARMIQRDGGIGVTERQIAFTLRDFDKAKRKVYGVRRLFRGVPDEDVVALDRALKGEIPVSQLPEPFRVVVTKMRNEVDALSRRLIDSGAIEGPLKATIEKNIGSYATRSFRVFDDPDWALKVSQDVRNKAKALIRGEFPQLTEAEVAGQIEALLYRGKEAGSHIGLMGKLGSKDLSILKRRSDIPPEIRALWGEFDDVTVNYARSATKMAHLIENHHFLTDVRREGLGKFFFDRPVVRGGEAYQAQIAAEGSKALEPLDGLYTTPEIARAFREIAVQPQIPDWLRHYMKVNGAVKFTKTILSLMTHVRNVVGNVGFAVVNGHWRVTKSADALRAIGANTGITDIISSPKNIERWRNYFLKLQKLRVVDESARAGELQDVLTDAIKGNLSDPARSFPVRVMSVGLKAAKSLYRAEDDVWKVFAFENELARYRQAWPGVPIERLEAHVAEIVRNTYPTYSLVPRGVKFLRRFPLMGNFVSFPAEVGRTLYHTMKLTSVELADPALRGIGAQRLVGMMTAATAVAGAATATRHMFGIEKGTDDDMRRFLPDWSENSTLLHLGRSPDGNLRVIDLSYTDPYSYLRTPLKAFLRGENWEDKIIDAVLEAAEPFIGEEILFGKLQDISRNAKGPNGPPVFNPQDPFLDRMDDILAHVYDALEPGTITSAKRIEKGLTGKTTPYGKGFDAKLEIMAVLTGLRIMEVDIAQSLGFKVGKYNRDQRDAMQILRGPATRRGTVTDDELREATASMERARQENFKELHEDIQAAERLGVSSTAIRRILSGRLSRQSVNDLIFGRYRPYQPTNQFLRSLNLDVGERLRRIRLIQGRIGGGGNTGASARNIGGQSSALDRLLSTAPQATTQPAAGLLSEVLPGPSGGLLS